MNVLIAEDEAPAARRLERMVRELLGSRLGGICVAETAEDARSVLAATRIDLLLLDLNLNGIDGFSLLAAVERPATIVVSARSDRAIDAFDHAVIDFVTKPVSASRLSRAIDRALDSGRGERSGGRNDAHASLAVRSAGRIDLATFADIAALSGADDYVEVVLADGRRFLHDSRLQVLQLRLPPGFVRVHRSHIVNAAHVRTLRMLPNRRRVLVLSGDTTVPVSRSRSGEITRLLKTNC